MYKIIDNKYLAEEVLSSSTGDKITLTMKIILEIKPTKIREIKIDKESKRLSSVIRTAKRLNK